MALGSLVWDKCSVLHSKMDFYFKFNEYFKFNFFLPALLVNQLSWESGLCRTTSFWQESQNSLIWEMDKKTKQRVDLYHYKIDVYTHINDQTSCKLNFTSDDPFTFTFTHLADAFIQSDLQCIEAIHFLSVCVFPGNWTHNLCAANAML